MMKDVFYYNVYTFVHSNGLLGEKKKRMERESGMASFSLFI